jgi:hypothetical protein
VPRAPRLSRRGAPITALKAAASVGNMLLVEPVPWTCGAAQSGAGGTGGAGIGSSGTIATLANSGAISGGNGGNGGATASVGGAGGDGIDNLGTITTLPTAGQFEAETAAPAIRAGPAARGSRIPPSSDSRVRSRRSRITAKSRAETGLGLAAQAARAC